jgi:hypothetical protein
MGWSGASDIFNVVADAMRDSGRDDVELLDRLIGELNSGDWDTQDESLEEFATYPPAVEAFRRHGFHLGRCKAKHEYTSLHDRTERFTCYLPYRHFGEHQDRGIRWSFSEG